MKLATIDIRGDNVIATFNKWAWDRCRYLLKDEPTIRLHSNKVQVMYFDREDIMRSYKVAECPDCGMGIYYNEQADCYDWYCDCYVGRADEAEALLEEQCGPHGG